MRECVRRAHIANQRVQHTRNASGAFVEKAMGKDSAGQTEEPLLAARGRTPVRVLGKPAAKLGQDAGNVDFHRADVGARSAQRAGKG
mgnify:CR=1 FL=1